MHNIAAPVWNRIAPLAQNPTWKHLFALDAAGQARGCEAIARALEAQGVKDPLVRLAYLELAPMLTERDAIRAWVKVNPNYRAAFPEILSTNEALLIAVKDHLLRVSQTRQLRKLLDAPPPAL